MANVQEPRKALLCFHGTGSKGSIFNVQMARIHYQLQDDFEFVFIDGPRDSPPGPGVLPMFADQGPYYGWFGGYDSTIDDSIRSIDKAVQKGLSEWRTNNPDGDLDIVGGIGFSEGGLVLAMLLWLQRQQQQEYEGQQLLFSSLPLLRFAVINCCFFPREASLWMNARAQAQGEKSAIIDVPTLHVHGTRDFCLGRARQLVRNHYRPQNATVLNVDTSHRKFLPS